MNMNKPNGRTSRWLDSNREIRLKVRLNQAGSAALTKIATARGMTPAAVLRDSVHQTAHQ